MPWLVIYIGFLFPVALLLVVLATDWRQRQHERRRASIRPPDLRPSIGNDSLLNDSR